MDKKRNITVGVLAHVDAGKTTLCEAMLYLAGRIKNLGRVDHRDSYLDTHRLERERGITIFAKQAVMELPQTVLTLLDTPGHVDFSAEMERTLRVLDYAILVISGTDGVQAHTETLWRLLERYAVPTLLFVTKRDLPGMSERALTEQLRGRLSEGCADFSAPREEWEEAAALCSETAMEEYLETGALSPDTLASLIRERKLCPCFFGSGLRLEGVDALLTALDSLTREGQYATEFAASVFKIGRDGQGGRMSYLKITGGSLRVRSVISYRGENGERLEEKITQLRVYSGARFETREEVFPGEVCAALGLSATYAGQGLGAEPDADSPFLEPVMSYRLLLPADCDARLLYPKLRQLAEEDPQLHLLWNERSREMSVLLMGRVQAEVFCRLVQDRFDVSVTLDTGRVLYRETIADKVEGVGHFEPLRHYAEVHLLMEPLPAGSGIVLQSSCGEDRLDRNWQRLILTHLAEKQHLGVLTGSPITDMCITLAAGKAHLKHTEGGDFREATYRAVRQGLMQARSVLLEPWYSFTLELPNEQAGRAISDIRTMGGTFALSSDGGEWSRIQGAAPVSGMNEYMNELTAYTRGRGRLSLRPDGFRPCKNPEAVIEAMGYEPERDLENTPDSVFCAHGAGFTVKWNEVAAYMHLESCLAPTRSSSPPPPHRSLNIDERELEAIMEREFGPIRRAEYGTPGRVSSESTRRAGTSGRKSYILVDGYNLIFSWPELKALAEDRLDLARVHLMDMLSDYAAFTRTELVLVFDAYRTAGNAGAKSDYHSIHVAFTRDGETADSYLQSLADDVGKNYAVRIVTDDNMIRLSAMGSGVLRQSCGEFQREVEGCLARIRQIVEKTNENAHKMRLKDGKQGN